MGTLENMLYNSRADSGKGGKEKLHEIHGPCTPTVAD